jgi:hypothetical protein
VYESELKRKDEIDKLMAFPVTVLSIFAGTSYFVIKQYIDRWDNTLSVFDAFFFLLCAAFVYIFLNAVYHLVQVFYKDKREYIYLPHLEVLDEYRDKELIAKYPCDDPEQADAVLDAMTEKLNLALLNYYSQFSTNNGKINDDRTESYYKARRFIVASCVSFVALSVFGLVNLFIEAKKEGPTPPNSPATFNIYHMSDQKPTPPPKPAPQPASTPAPPPPGRIIREHQEPGIHRKVVPPPPNKK